MTAWRNSRTDSGGNADASAKVAATPMNRRIQSFRPNRPKASMRYVIVASSDRICSADSECVRLVYSAHSWSRIAIFVLLHRGESGVFDGPVGNVTEQFTVALKAAHRSGVSVSRLTSSSHRVMRVIKVSQECAPSRHWTQGMVARALMRFPATSTLGFRDYATRSS